MSDQFWLSETQLKRIEPYFPKPRGIPRMDDRRMVSGIIHIIRNGLLKAHRTAASLLKGGFIPLH